MSHLPSNSRAFWITGPQMGEIRAAEIGPRASNQVLVAARYSCVSRGTESLVFGGGVPVNVYEQMRAPHQEGEFPWPIKYGYSSVGRVLDGPDELRDRSVFCLYPHQDYYAVDGAAVVPLPDDVPPERAILAANMETALNSVWDAELCAGDVVTVVGGGVVGSLVAYLAAQYPGTRVELVDVEPSRANVASRFGASFCLAHDASKHADIIFHSSGQPEGLRLALRLAAPEATIVELSWYGTTEVTLPLGENFHHGRLRIIGSQVGRVAPRRRSRYTMRTRLQKALELCADPALDVLIDDESPFEQLPQTMSRLMDSAALCHRIVYA